MMFDFDIAMIIHQLFSSIVSFTQSSSRRFRMQGRKNYLEGMLSETEIKGGKEGRGKKREGKGGKRKRWTSGMKEEGEEGK